MKKLVVLAEKIFFLQIAVLLNCKMFLNHKILVYHGLNIIFSSVYLCLIQFLFQSSENLQFALNVSFILCDNSLSVVSPPFFLWEIIACCQRYPLLSGGYVSVPTGARKWDFLLVSLEEVGTACVEAGYV